MGQISGLCLQEQPPLNHACKNTPSYFNQKQYLIVRYQECVFFPSKSSHPLLCQSIIFSETQFPVLHFIYLSFDLFTLLAATYPINVVIFVQVKAIIHFRYRKEEKQFTDLQITYRVYKR